MRFLLHSCALSMAVLVACGDPTTPTPSTTPLPEVCLFEGDAPGFTLQVGCEADFQALASRPLNTSIPGARSVKVLVDRASDDTLYFMNTTRYPRHFDFAAAELSGDPLPPVVDIALFNQTEYRSPNRRFLLGAVTYYEAPAVWAYEIAPYDSASADMVALSMSLIGSNSYFGDRLCFHPTSVNTAAAADGLPAGTCVVTTDEIFAGTDYQPLKLGEAYGQLRFFTAEQLQTEYVGPRDVVVLDVVPNDISVVAGLITAQVQTPLSHVNVLAQNRGTPNMALRGAFDSPALRSLENRWVRLTVGEFDYAVVEASRADADAWWDAHRPPAVQVPNLDLEPRDLRDVRELNLVDVTAYGGKAVNFGVMARIETVPAPDAFAVPVYYYKQFEAQNGFDEQIAALQADPRFVDDPAFRQAALRDLQQAMITAPVDSQFEALLKDKLEREHPAVRMRFRSSTNAEDLDGFTGAGLYASHSGELGDPNRAVLDAVRSTWASLWNFRAYEERTYNGIPHESVAMALLVHHSFRREEANGVALTNNPFDASQAAFYVNVQFEEYSVVSPAPGETVDAFLYYYGFPGQPTTYLSSSNFVPEGSHVLTPEQVTALGRALADIHEAFAPHYQKDGQFYAMDVEFKFDDLDEAGNPSHGPPKLWVKQARPHPGRGEQ
jgi:pyruvate, water dikinase